MKRNVMWQAAAVIGGAALVDLCLGVVTSLLLPELPLVVVGTINGGLTALAVVWLLSRLGLWREAGFRAPDRPQSLLWFAPLLVYGLLPLAQGVRETPGIALAAVVFAWSISFWKVGALVLGVVLLRPLGVWRAAGLASALFGLVHVLALFVGANTLPTVINILANGLLGFAIAALYLRTGLSWPSVVLYGLLLFSVALTGGLDAPNMATDVAALLPAVVVSGLLAVIGLGALATRPQAQQMSGSTVAER